MRVLTIVMTGFAVAGATLAVAQTRDWNRTVVLTPVGTYLQGNPKAKVKLVEYISYTCNHCAAFSSSSSAVLKGQMVNSGSTSVEFRNAARDRLDLAAAMLARCAGPAGFFGANDAILAKQSEWLGRATTYETANAAQLKKLPPLAAIKLLANGSGLSALMMARGMSKARVSGCFADQKQLDRIVAITDASWKKIKGTPAFEINGAPVTGFDWAALEPRLRAAGAK